MPISVEQVKRWQAARRDQLLPIVYLRGYAMTEGEVDDTTADPFNGFNIGSVVLRTGWTGRTARHIFESPILRLTQPPFNYRLTFSDGVRGLGGEAKKELNDWRTQGDGTSPPAAVIAICRYYDIESRLVGDGQAVGMETFGWGVGRLVLDLLDATGAEGVYIVAHSMGGLVARTFLQNPGGLRSAVIDSLVRDDAELGISNGDWTRARRAVRRFFTYGTPHNGITGQGGLGNGLLGLAGAVIGFRIDNFERKRMMQYLATDDPKSLNGTFPIEDAFCLVGTGSADYPAAGGFSRRLVGQRSDGLVELDNAVLCAPGPDGDTVLAPSAYVRRAHSGPYGMVNSEEGFGNLVRFLFGDARIDGELVVRQLDLPLRLQDMGRGAGSTVAVRASYGFEVFLRVRGKAWAMTERMAQDGAALFRRYDEMFPDNPPPGAPAPTEEEARRRRWHRRIGLFTCFLDTELRTRQELEMVGGQPRPAMGFALRLRVGTPDYEVDGQLHREDHYEGSAIFDQDLVFMAFREDDNGWGLAYGTNTAMVDPATLQVVGPAPDGAAPEDAVPAPGSAAFRRPVPDPADPRLEFWIPLRAEGPPIFAAWLKLTARWRSR